MESKTKALQFKRECSRKKGLEGASCCLATFGFGGLRFGELRVLGFELRNCEFREQDLGMRN